MYQYPRDISKHNFQTATAYFAIGLSFFILFTALIFPNTGLVKAQDASVNQPPTLFLYDTTPESGFHLPSWLALEGVRYKRKETEKFDQNQMLQLQTQRPVTLCAETDSPFACQQKIEAFLLDQGTTGIIRNGYKLRIPLSHSGLAIFTNEPDRHYVYRGYMPIIHYHHITVYFYEGSQEILINEYTGETTLLPYEPMISPDGRYVAAVGSSFSLPFRAQIWEVRQLQLSLAVDYFIEEPRNRPYLTQIVAHEWHDRTKLRLSVIRESSTITDTLTLTLSGTDWRMSFNEKELQVQPFHPATVNSKNFPIITEISTLKIGKKAYRDREYRFIDIPTFLEEQQFLLFDNNNTRNTDPAYVRFNLTRPALIYIAIDEQATSLPGWMGDEWTPTGDAIRTDDIVAMKIYKKHFEPGEVILGGNWMPPAAGIRSHYIAIITPATSP